MYLKMFLLFCLLHFFKAAWGVGLTESEIDTINYMFDNYKGFQNEIPKNIVVQIVLDMGCYKLIKVYPSEETVIENKTAPEFLMTIASIEKDSDDVEDKGLTSYEVKLFLTMFDIQDKKSEPDGLLNYVELVQLLDNDLHLEPDVEKEIKNTLKDNDAINAPKFLAVILEHKPEGKGLDKTQIEKIAQLYTPNSGSQLNYSLLQAFIKSLNIVSDAHLELMDFKNERPPAYELQEFIAFWSVYNKEIEGNFFSSNDITISLYEFNQFDTDNDGFIGYYEFEPVSRLYFSQKKIGDAYRQYIDRLRLMTIAMYLDMKYVVRFENPSHSQGNVSIVDGNNNVTLEATDE